MQLWRRENLALCTVVDVRLPPFKLGLAKFAIMPRNCSSVLCYWIVLHLGDERTKTEFVVRRIGGRRGGVGFLCPSIYFRGSG